LRRRRRRRDALVSRGLHDVKVWAAAYWATDSRAAAAREARMVMVWAGGDEVEVEGTASDEEEKSTEEER
jgi:hypothetical protein